MKKNIVILLVFIVLLLFGCSNNEKSEMPQADISEVPQKITLHPFSNDIPGEWSYTFTEEEQADFWKKLQTEAWEEVKKPKDSNFVVGQEIYFIDKNNNEFSIAICQGFSRLSHSEDYLDGYIEEEHFYEIPNSVFTEVKNTALILYQKETTEISIDNISSFLAEIPTDDTITVLGGTPYQSDFKYSFHDAPEISAAFADFFQNMNGWQQIDGETFGNFPNICDYVYSVELHFEQREYNALTIHFYRRDNGSYLEVIFEGKPFYYYSEEEITLEFVNLCKTYADSDLVTVLQ